jgi:RimJ/RimL family protein N-acetyltransferase
MNGFDQACVSIRPMRSEDVAALARWERHPDPAFRNYDIGPLTPKAAAELWRSFSDPEGRRRPFVVTLGERIVGHVVLRDIDHVAGTAEVGIMLDPGVIGRGLGRRILRQFAGDCAQSGLRRLTLEVLASNERALRAYKAAGFVTFGERFGPPSPGAPPARIIQMETELPPQPFRKSNQ